ncbi:FecR family protein [Lunatibacter salilacus]|uniref:FecR family protein n=1 Tax=Lunatibacter salilacus TaxID=2483804 RepID=UPI00131B9D39|nr:FecR family protein [Lunatibacter salilacus]
MISPLSHIFIQLISNRDFVLWVNHPNEEREIFWQNWSLSNSDAHHEILRAREFIQRLQFKDDYLLPEEMDDLLGKVLAKEYYYKAEWSKPSLQFSRLVQKQWIRVVAILLVSFLVGISIERIYPTLEADPIAVEIPLRTVENPRGLKSTFSLPDGTEVHLNYESSLTFPRQFGGTDRRVELVGEAFFDVAHHDSVPFIVLTEGMSIEVLGTSFNVLASEEDYQTRVSLVRGKVLVNFLDQREGLENQILSPGHEVGLDRRSGEFTVTTFHVEQIVGWKDGIMLFQDASMTEFINRLEKWYGVNIQIFGRPGKPWKINARYENEMLEDILIGLKFVYNIEYQVKGKNIWIKIND